MAAAERGCRAKGIDRECERREEEGVGGAKDASGGSWKPRNPRVESHVHARTHTHTFPPRSTLLLENSDALLPLRFRLREGRIGGAGRRRTRGGEVCGNGNNEMRSCRGQLLTLEKFPGSHRSARAKGCPMKSIADDDDSLETRCPLARPTPLPPKNWLRRDELHESRPLFDRSLLGSTCSKIYGNEF